MSESPNQNLEEDLLDLGSLIYNDLDDSIPSPGILDSPGDGETGHTTHDTGNSAHESVADEGVEEPNTHIHRSLTSRVGDDQAGDSFQNSDVSMEVDSDSILRRIDSDVTMRTAQITDSDMTSSYISSSRNELQTIFEGATNSNERGDFGPIDTSQFGRNYHLALAKLLQIHSQFTHTGEFTKTVTWSAKIRNTRMEEIRQKSEEAYDELIQSIFLDRNIRFRMKSGESSESLSPPTQTPKAPVKGPSTEYSTTSSPETLKFACICESVHSAIFNCANAHAHKSLCEKTHKTYAAVAAKCSNTNTNTGVSNTRRVLLDTPKAPPVTHYPSTSSDDLSRSRNITQNQHQTRKDTRSRSPYNRNTPPNKKETAYQKHKREARERELKVLKAQNDVKNGLIPLNSCYTKTKITTPTQNIPTSSQIAKLMTDLGAGKPSLITPPLPTRQPAQHGDCALGPDGQVDFSRMPEPPPNMPSDLTFEVRVESNKWHVSYTKNQK